MTHASDIISAMQNIPPHKTALTPGQTTRLRDLTRQLIEAKPDAPAEHQRFLNIKNRSLPLPEEQLRDRLHGATVLVTGGTGCIGSTLMNQIMRYQPDHLFSVSRGVTTGYSYCPGAQYLMGDVRNQERIDNIIRWVRPDVIFHVVAQRSPSLAETEVRRTVTTNVFGTRNVLTSALKHNIPQVVCASTGKALRPYSPEIYTASKRAAEWVAVGMAERGLLVSAGRFTHVIDNSIVYQRLRQWVEGGVVRLHKPDIAFYVQSALESAQLLLNACVGASPGVFRVHAINNLGWPVCLLDVVLGAVAGSGTPVYFSGYDPGYEEVPFPGLYDPRTAGDVSPLINAFEAARITSSGTVDVFDLKMAQDPMCVKLLGELELDCEQSDAVTRDGLDRLSWSLLDATLAKAPLADLRRCAALIKQHARSMTPVHQRITDLVRGHAGIPSCWDVLP